MADGPELGFGALISMRDGFTGPANTMLASAMRLETRMGIMSRSVTVSLKGMAAGMAVFVAGAGITAGFDKIIDKSTQFQAAMNEVAARLGSNVSPQFESLRKDALRLGSSTVFSANQVAMAQAELTKAGYGTQQVLASMPGVLDVAATEHINLASAANITVTALKQFELGADKAGHVADVLAVAANATLASVEGLGNGLTYVGPIANQFNKTIEETVAAMSLLSDRGIDASMSGTSLRQALSDLAKPTSDARKELARLGLTAADVNPMTNTLVQIVGKFSAAGADMNNVLRLMDVRAANAFAALLEIGPGALAELQKRLIETNGAAHEMAELQMAGLPGAFAKLRGAADALIIRLGDLGPAFVVEKAVRGLTGWLTRMTAAAENNGLVKFGLAAVAATGGILMVAGATLFFGNALKLLMWLAPIAFGAVISGMAALAPMILPILLLGGAFSIFTRAITGGKFSIVDSLSEIVDRGRLFAKGFMELMSSASGSTAKMSAETAEALEKAGLLDFTLKLFGIADRAREFGRGMLQGIGTAFTQIADIIRLFLPEGTSIRKWFDDMVVSVSNLSINSTIQEWREFGQTVGGTTTFLAGATVALYGFGAAISFLKTPFGILWKSILLTKAAIIILLNPISVMETAYLKLLYAWDAVTAAASRFMGVTTAGRFINIVGAIFLVVAAVRYFKDRWDALTESFKLQGILGPLKVMLADALGLVIKLNEWGQKIPGIGAIFGDESDLKRMRKLQRDIFESAGLNPNTGEPKRKPKTQGTAATNPFFTGAAPEGGPLAITAGLAEPPPLSDEYRRMLEGLQINATIPVDATLRLDGEVVGRAAMEYQRRLGIREGE